MTSIKKHASLLLLATAILAFHPAARAYVTITKATGGTGISADKAANAASPAWTTLGNVVVTEGTATDFAVGTNVSFRLSCPAGWSFNTLASVTASAGTSNDISSASVTSVTSTLISVSLTITGNTNPDTLTISGIQVRANEGGNIPCSGSITRGGTAIIAGCVAGMNLGSLSQVAGAMNKLVITMPGQVFSDASMAASSGTSGTATSQTSGTSFTITKIRACDQFYNVVTTYGGVKTISYSGPSNGLTAPNYITSVSFSSGVSSTILITKLKKAEVTTLTVSDGTITGPTSSSFTVNPGAVANYVVESSSLGNIGTQVTGLPFTIRITARDANNNICSAGPNAFTGTAMISSTGALTSGGTTTVFSAGVLASHSVTISNQGTFTVTATKTGGTAAGSSNSFTVNYPNSSLSSINPSCVNAGGSAFTLTATGTNFTGSSVVRINGSGRNTTYIDSVTLDADVLTGDIAIAGAKSISVFTPGTGITAALLMGMNSGSTANVTICQGSFYTLPDGIVRNSAGSYTSHIPTSTGCDSTIVTNLSVNPILTRTQNVVICPNSVFVLPDHSTQGSPGTYITNVHNQTGCDSSITTNLSFYPAPMLIATPSQILCYGSFGSVSLTPGGGVGPYTLGTAATTHLAAGTYNFTMTDANACTAIAVATIAPAPTRLVLTATPTPIACFGGTASVSLSSSGGTQPYSYNGTATDSLSAGSYSYQVTDNNGCTATVAAVIHSAPPAITGITSSSNTPCGTSGGTVNVSVAGGTGPYTYLWSTSATTRNVTGLPIGTYSVVITDSRGCTLTKSATVGQLSQMTLSITGGTGICPGGASTTLCATAGYASYSWNTGATTSCITVSTPDTFTVTVTDTLGCSGTRTVVTNNSTNPSCTITGGTLCYNSSVTLRSPTGYASYLWSNGIRTSYNTVRSAGTYSVTVTNTAGCTSNCSYTVNSPMRVTASKIDGKCANEFKGSASVNATSGIQPYTYLWNNGETTNAISGLAAGTYSIRVTDAGGCVSINTFSVLSNKVSNDYSSQVANFNSTPVDSATYVWYSAVANINYTGDYPVTLHFINQNISSSRFNLNPPNAKLIITTAVSQASTTFTGGEWVTTAPPDLTGNYFVGGYAHLVSLSIPASLTGVRWKGIWTSSSSCVTVIHWKWAAAVYTDFSTDHSLVDVNPVDDVSASPFGNGDFAGTPENYKADCSGGALSTGPTDYTGVYSAVINRAPCSTADSCNSVRPKFIGANLLKDDLNFFLNAYPNPFYPTTNIQFERVDKASHLKIDIYNMFGKLVRTIFDKDIDANVPYTIEFDAADLPTGIYFYRLTTEGKEASGKLYLKR